MTPLYNHTSVETSYLIADYPCGFRARCQMRVWLEKSNKNGFRFCSQTTNKSGGWCAVKKSFYQTFAGNLFLDDKGHVTWLGLHEYSLPSQIHEFVRTFPESDFSILAPYLKAKMKFEGLCSVATHSPITINGVASEYSDDDRHKHAASAKLLEDALFLVRSGQSMSAP
jgi:hypothetical protein